MFKEVCGHLIALATVLVVLPYLRFLFLVGFEEETRIPTLRKRKLQLVRVNEDSMLLLHKKWIKIYKLVTGI